MAGAAFNCPAQLSLPSQWEVARIPRWAETETSQHPRDSKGSAMTANAPAPSCGAFVRAPGTFVSLYFGLSESIIAATAGDAHGWRPGGVESHLPRRPGTLASSTGPAATPDRSQRRSSCQAARCSLRPVTQPFRESIQGQLGNAAAPMAGAATSSAREGNAGADQRQYWPDRLELRLHRSEPPDSRVPRDRRLQPSGLAASAEGRLRNFFLSARDRKPITTLVSGS
jgi:hypothetical protein